MGFTELALQLSSSFKLVNFQSVEVFWCLW